MRGSAQNFKRSELTFNLTFALEIVFLADKTS